MTLTEHARAVRKAIRALDKGDPALLAAAVDWDHAQVWAREALAAHIRIPVAGSAPWALVVHRIEDRVTARVTGHTWSRDVPGTEALLAEALARTAHLCLFDVGAWLKAAGV